MAPGHGRSVSVIEDLAQLARLTGEWDELAVRAGRPLAAPGWLLAWWRNMAPAGARLRTVAVHDGDRLVGLAPFFATRVRTVVIYRPLGSAMAIRGTLLADAGREQEVAGAVADALAEASPRPAAIHLDQLDVGSPWPGLLAARWPGRARPRTTRRGPASAPTLHLSEDSYADWLRGKSGNFRQRIRRDTRKLEERGAQTRMARTPEELERALAVFGHLHGDRWGEQSALTGAAGARMMLEAGRELLDSERFRVWTIEIDGEPITVQIFLAAGGEVSYWNGAWDPDFASLSPAMLGLCAAIEDAFGRGERRLDLGEGSQHYKTRLADGDEQIDWVQLYPRGRGHARALAVLALPQRSKPLARAAAQRLPTPARTLVTRLRAGDLPRSRSRAPGAGASQGRDRRG